LSKCNNPKSCKRSDTYNRAKWIPAILIALLPKCPFCLMAYSGAVTLCSGTTMYPNASSNMPFLILGISLVVLISLLLNYKKVTTMRAIILVSIGMLLMISSQLYFMNNASYYLGAGFLFFGVWYNGSFNYFYKKYFKIKFNKTRINI